MEAELLRGMISDRDQRIERIQQKTEEQRLRAVELSEQLERVGNEVAQQTDACNNEKKEIMRKKCAIVEKLEQTQRDFRQQGVSLQTYSKDKVRDGADASYVMRMQAQLCKAMHSLGITDHQMELAETHADSDIKHLKETQAACTEERTATELELMNQLILKDNERREIESVFTAQLDKIAKEHEALERQIEENGGDEDEDDTEAEDEEDEEDAEEKEAKEEMMKLLTERRVEIETLEQHQEEQEELIAELEDQVRDMEANVQLLKKSGTIARNESNAIESMSDVKDSLNEEEDELDEEESKDGFDKETKNVDDSDNAGVVDDNGEKDDMQEETSDRKLVEDDDGMANAANDSNIVNYDEKKISDMDLLDSHEDDDDAGVAQIDTDSAANAGIDNIIVSDDTLEISGKDVIDDWDRENDTANNDEVGSNDRFAIVVSDTNDDVLEIDLEDLINATEGHDDTANNSGEGNTPTDNEADDMLSADGSLRRTAVESSWEIPIGQSHRLQPSIFKHQNGQDCSRKEQSGVT